MSVYYNKIIKLNNELFYTNKNDGRVFIIHCSKRITIGKLCSDDSDFFHPSDGYFNFIERLSDDAKKLLHIPTKSAETPQKPIELKVKKKPGRPKGSLNKKTIAAMEAKAKAEQEALARGEPLPVVEKRKPGRPKGSLNKKTIAAMEAKAKAEQEALARGEPLPVVEKRKPGRPKGSLNKRTIAAMEAKDKADLVRAG